MQSIDDDKLKRMLRQNRVLLAVNLLLLLVCIVLWITRTISGIPALVIAVNIPMLIINIINVKRIRQGRKPF